MCPTNYRVYEMDGQNNNYRKLRTYIASNWAFRADLTFRSANGHTNGIHM